MVNSCPFEVIWAIKSGSSYSLMIIIEKVLKALPKLFNGNALSNLIDKTDLSIAVFSIFLGFCIWNVRLL